MLLLKYSLIVAGSLHGRMMKQSLESRLGQYLISTVGGEQVKSFLPPHLPPRPSIVLDAVLDAFHESLGRANLALGRLDFVTRFLPDPAIFIDQYVRKEALLSSQIEGTQSSFSDLLLFEENEETSVPFDDIVEVSSYVMAVNHGLKRLNEGFPLCLRLLKEIHSILLSEGRGQDKYPGEFRTSANWIGGTRPGNALYVPPPPDRLMECLDAFEKFLHQDSSDIPLLVKAALCHVQFETIHPFLDGNGRLGRLLITLLLCNGGVLAAPTLYLSLYLKAHRDEYYDRLQRVRTEGDWESWLGFFLEGIYETAEQGTESAQQILKLFNEDRDSIQNKRQSTVSMLRLHQLLQKRPVVSIDHACKQLDLSFPTVTKAFMSLEHLGIVEEMTGKQRGRIFVYRQYLNILSEGTAPLPP
jgi:Fic family protein